MPALYIHGTHNESVKLPTPLRAGAYRIFCAYQTELGVPTTTSTGGLIVYLSSGNGSLFQTNDVLSYFEGIAYPGALYIPHVGGTVPDIKLCHSILRVDTEIEEIKIKIFRADGIDFGDTDPGEICIGIETPEHII